MTRIHCPFAFLGGGIQMKKLLSLAAAGLVILSCLSAGVFAAPSPGDPSPGSVLIDAGTGVGAAYDEDGMPISGTVYNGGSLEGFEPDQTVYLKLSKATLLKASDGTDGKSVNDGNLLADKDLFKLKVKKEGDGRGLVKEVSQVSEKKDANGTRCGWVKIIIAPSDLTEEQKAELSLTFIAKEDENGWAEGDYAAVNLNLWISPPIKSGDDYDADPGEQFVYHPVSNEKNGVNWDSVATLSFTADDDASKFYAKLSTKADGAVCERYPDAELYFRDFSGTPAISASSRATLTLLNPFAQEDNVQVNPESCHIYTKDAEGELADVTSLFTYLDTDEDGNEVDGWRIKTRMLGSYVISDVPLDTADGVSGTFLTRPETVELAGSSADTGYAGITSNTKPNPPTGRI